MNSIINLKKTNLEREYFLIKALISQLDAKFKSENEDIIKIIKELESEVPLYVNDITLLNEEIKNLRMELQVKTPSDTINSINESIAKEVDKEEDDDNLDIKKMYRLISSKCHPDKTEDTELHDLFMLATEAYHSHNYSMVLEIYHKLSKTNSNFSFSDISIEQKLEIIKKEYEKRKEEYNKLTITNGYTINNLVKANKRTHARKVFLDLLFNQTLELEALKSQLKNNLSKKS